MTPNPLLHVSIRLSAANASEFFLASEKNLNAAPNFKLPKQTILARFDPLAPAPSRSMPAVMSVANQ